MKHLARFLLVFVCAVGLGASSARAGYDGEYVLSKSLGVLLNGVALNANAGSRTITVTPNQQYVRLILTVNFTYGAASTVTVTPKCTDNALTTAGSITSASVSSGTSTDTVYTRSFATGSASANFQWSFSVLGAYQCTYLLGGASAGSSDTVVVTGTLAAM